MKAAGKRSWKRKASGAFQKEENDDKKVDIWALELLMDPEDSEVCLRYILAHAKRRGSKIFDIFSTKEY